MYDGTFCRRIEMCRLLVAMRDVVGGSLGFDTCPNPIWDMLLDLYLARYEDREVYLWPLCIASHCPLSTAHRKVLLMERSGLVVRANKGRDRRRTHVTMTDEGAAIMDWLLDRMTDKVFDFCPREPV
jgi:hypothetical protein